MLDCSYYARMQQGRGSGLCGDACDFLCSPTYDPTTSDITSDTHVNYFVARAGK